MKFALLLCLAGSALAEDLPAYSPLESFLMTVDQRSRLTETAPPSTSVPATIQAALGFTDAEMQALNAIAREFVHRGSALRAPTSNMVFEARLELAETGKESDTLKQFTKQVNAELAEALAKSMRDLRSALGDERYQKFDSWFRAGGAKGCWVAPCSATPKR